MTHIALSALFAFVFVVVVLRALGKRELSQMSAFDLVLLFVIGDLVAETIVREDTSMTAAVVAITTLALATSLMSWLTWRFRRLRRPLEGIPVVIIRDGRLLHQALDRERLTRQDLLEAARENGIRDLRDVELAVLEPDGDFSFFTASS